MKTVALPFLLVLSLACHISYAQNSIFAGKIVDENNKPVPGAIIKISSKTTSPVEAKSDSDGLYCTKPIATGHYHLAVFLNSECRGLKNVVLDEASGSKKFFLIKMGGGSIDVSAVDKDPAMAVKLDRINSRHDMDGGNRVGTYRLPNDNASFYYHRKDSLIKKENAAPVGEKTPQIK